MLTPSTPLKRENPKQSPPELFTTLHLTWLNGYQFDEPHLLEIVALRAKKLSLSRGFFERARWYGAYYRKEIQAPKVADFSVRWINDQVGFGLYATRDLPSGYGIGPYLGKVRQRSYFLRGSINPYCFALPIQPPYWQKILFGSWTIDAMQSGNHTRFINHSLQCNCEAVPALFEEQFYIMIISNRPIKKDEQLFFDYGEKYWRSRKDQQNLLHSK